MKAPLFFSPSNYFVCFGLRFWLSCNHSRCPRSLVDYVSTKLNTKNLVIRNDCWRYLKQRHSVQLSELMGTNCGLTTFWSIGSYQLTISCSGRTCYQAADSTSVAFVFDMIHNIIPCFYLLQRLQISSLLFPIRPDYITLLSLTNMIQIIRWVLIFREYSYSVLC